MTTCENLVSGMCFLTGRKFDGKMPSKIGGSQPEDSIFITRNCGASNDKTQQAECDRFKPINDGSWDEQEENFLRWFIENGGWVNRKPNKNNLTEEGL